MHKIDKTRPILTELIVGMMFFLVCAALLLRLFGASYGLIRKTGFQNSALNQCENIIDSLTVSSNPEETLRQLGFDESGLLDAGDYTLRMTSETQHVTGGSLYRGRLTAGTGEEDWFTLCVSVCLEAQP